MSAEVMRQTQRLVRVPHWLRHPRLKRSFCDLAAVVRLECQRPLCRRGRRPTGVPGCTAARPRCGYFRLGRVCGAVNKGAGRAAKQSEDVSVGVCAPHQQLSLSLSLSPLPKTPRGHKRSQSIRAPASESQPSGSSHITAQICRFPVRERRPQNHFVLTKTNLKWLQMSSGLGRERDMFIKRMLMMLYKEQRPRQRNNVHNNNEDNNDNNNNNSDKLLGISVIHFQLQGTGQQQTCHFLASGNLVISLKQKSDGSTRIAEAVIHSNTPTL